MPSLTSCVKGLFYGVSIVLDKWTNTKKMLKAGKITWNFGDFWCMC